MPYFDDRRLALCSLPFLILLGGFTARPECDSRETRNAVLKTISDDHSNRLAVYAAENAPTNKDGAGNGNPETAKPTYALGEKIITTSTTRDKRTLNCSTEISVTIGETKASKDVNFTVQQASDGKISVSVMPFQF
jgi:hypothetical protein